MFELASAVGCRAGVLERAALFLIGVNEAAPSSRTHGLPESSPYKLGFDPYSARRPPDVCKSGRDPPNSKQAVRAPPV